MKHSRCIQRECYLSKPCCAPSRTSLSLLQWRIEKASRASRVARSRQSAFSFAAGKRIGNEMGSPSLLSLSLSLTTDGGTERQGAGERASIGRKKRPASASLTRRPTICPMGGRKGLSCALLKRRMRRERRGGNILIGKAAIATVIAIHNNALL